MKLQRLSGGESETTCSPAAVQRRRGLRAALPEDERDQSKKVSDSELSRDSRWSSGTEQERRCCSDPDSDPLGRITFTQDLNIDGTDVSLNVYKQQMVQHV